MDQERAALAALATRITIGQRTVERLYVSFGTLTAASRASLHALRAAGIGEDRAAKLEALPDGAALLASWERRGLRFLAYEDPEFPDAWRTLAAPPAFVLVQGDVAALHGPLVAIIGTRKATAYGILVSKLLVAYCRSAGFGTVAGLALGIDTAVHAASVLTRIPTVAVLAGGHDCLYPKENGRLAREIVATGGAVVSEVVPDTLPFTQRFIARNRLVAALSRFVTVVEAGKPSGTLTTVDHAHDLGRDVVAVPGKITSSASRGCSELLANGAIPLWDIGAFGEMLISHNEVVDPIVREVRRGNRDAESLCTVLGLPAHEFHMRILQLEMQGAIRRDASGLYLA